MLVSPRNEKLPRDQVTHNFFNGFLPYSFLIIPLISSIFFNFIVSLNYYKVHMMVYVHIKKNIDK